MEIHEKFCNPHLFSFSDFQLQFVYAYFTYAATLSTDTDDVTKMVMYRIFNTNFFYRHFERKIWTLFDEF